MTLSLFRINKNGYYYRPLARGYTDNPEEAGLFTLEEVATDPCWTEPDCADWFWYEEATEVEIQTYQRTLEEG